MKAPSGRRPFSTSHVLDEVHLPRRLQQLQHNRNGGTHDPATDDERIHILSVLGRQVSI